MYTHKLRKVKKTKSHYIRKNTKNNSKTKKSKTKKSKTKTSKTKTSKTKKFKITNFKQHSVLYGGTNASVSTNKKVMNITNESELEDFYKLSDDVLHKINKLSIKDCNKLHSFLPGNFGNLLALKKLEINNCNSLKYLPINFNSLKTLRILRIVNCNSLTSLSVNFGSFQALRILRIVKCNGLTSLPDTIGLCFNLKKFIISDIKLLPPSIILLPNVVININVSDIVTDMVKLREDCLAKIKTSTQPFYTTKIQELLSNIPTNYITGNLPSVLLLNKELTIKQIAEQCKSFNEFITFVNPPNPPKKSSNYSKLAATADTLIIADIASDVFF